MQVYRKSSGNSDGHAIAIVLAVLVIGGIVGTFLYVNGKNNGKSTVVNFPANNTSKTTAKTDTVSETDISKLKPEDFSTKITNKLMTMPVGRKLTYDDTNTKTHKVTEHTEISLGPETKVIGGFTTIVFHDRAYVNGQLKEDTKDYLAQYKNGDVWYFGEDVDNYKNGVLKDHQGSFLHGTDGAKAGILIKAVNKVGDSYRQENYAGKAEDTRDVVSVDQTVTTKLATYTGCVKFYDWNPLEAEDKEFKYACPSVGAEVFVQDLVEPVTSELTSVSG